MLLSWRQVCNLPSSDVAASLQLAVSSLSPNRQVTNLPPRSSEERIIAKPTPLQAQYSSASFTEEAGWLVPAHFGDPAAEYETGRTGAVVFDRSHYGKIEAAGNDTLVFLHNLSTHNVKALSPGAGCETFFCTPTAKVVSYGTIFRLPPAGKRETLWLDLSPGLDEKTFRHLDRYIIGEDVTLTDRTQALAQIHLAGPDAARVLSAALSEDSGAWTRATWSWS